MKKFGSEQLIIVNKAASMAEEIVSNYYKMSLTEWKRLRYDFKTLADLEPYEIVIGPLAQIIRYEGKPREASLVSSNYDFYKVCFQDNAILVLISERPNIDLFTLILYITIHELVHIVRFSKFLQNFQASAEEKQAEEKRVHDKTHEILKDIKLYGMSDVLLISDTWLTPIDNLRDSSEKYSL